MGLEDIGDFLNKLSPWVAGGMLIAWCFGKFLDYRSKIQEGSDALAYTKAVAALTKELQDVSTQQIEMRHELTKHVQADHKDQQTSHAALHKLVKLAEDQVVVQSRLVNEIIQLNAGDGILSTENAKLLISQQWAWCRNETYRITINSINNNHFAGNEDRVARIIFRAWQKAAMNVKKSLDAYKGLRYPYVGLFEKLLPIIWQRSWKLALPLYHRDHTSAEFKEDSLDLESGIHRLFDAALSGHFDGVEDIETGELYTERPGEPTLGDDSQTTEYMSNLLRAYKPGGKGIPSEVIDMRLAFKQQSTNTPSDQFPAIKDPRV